MSDRRKCAARRGNGGGAKTEKQGSHSRRDNVARIAYAQSFFQPPPGLLLNVAQALDRDRRARYRLGLPPLEFEVEEDE